MSQLECSPLLHMADNGVGRIVSGLGQRVSEGSCKVTQYSLNHITDMNIISECLRTCPR